MKLLMEQKVVEHEATIDYNEPRDFIDKVLIEIKQTTDPTSSFYRNHRIINSIEDRQRTSLNNGADAYFLFPFAKQKKANIERRQKETDGFFWSF
jgi:hypothetical protein